MVKSLNQIIDEFNQQHIVPNQETKNDAAGFLSKTPLIHPSEFYLGTVFTDDDPQKTVEIKPIRTVERKNGVSGEKSYSPVAIVRSKPITIFYAVICLLLMTSLVLSQKLNNGTRMFGYSVYTVLTKSMQSEIPKGSLVIAKSVDPDSIRIGDDVTYIGNDNSKITHRVVDITENYENNGARGFVTQGIENTDPDADIVSAADIIGVVKSSTPNLGCILSALSSQNGYIYALLGGMTAFVVFLLINNFKLLHSANKKEDD
jgi:signal peptidase